MTHLPECDYERQDYRGNDNRICFCSRLRACEQRMLDDDVPAAAYHGEKGYTMGYIAALDAAEAAVETWISYTFPAHRPGWTGNITAAIRSLKEKP